MSGLINLAKKSDVKRELMDITPHGASSLSLNGSTIVLFRLPRQGFLLGQDTVLSFLAEADGDAASDDVFMSNISCIWNSFRVRVDGQEVQHIRNYGHLKTLDDNIHHDTAYRTSWGAIAEGIPALSASGTAKRYATRFIKGNFLDNVIPLGKIGQVEVEFELNTSVAEYTNATTAVTEVDVTQLLLKCVVLHSEELKNYFGAKEVQIPFTDFDAHRDLSLLSGATSHTTIVPTSHASLDGILIHQRNVADVNDPNWGNEKYQIGVKNALSKLSFVVDGTQYPRREIDCTNSVELYNHLLEYGGHLKGQERTSPAFFVGGTNGYDAETDGQFLIAYPFNGLTGSKALSGLNTASQSGQLEIHFSAMSAGVNTQIDVFTRYTRVARFSKQGGLQVSK